MKRKNFFKKGMALLLCLSMCMGLLQTTAWAIDIGKDAQLHCGLPEHTHSAECNLKAHRQAEPCCDQTEHEHTSECYFSEEQTLACTDPALHHVHDDSCYEERSEERIVEPATPEVPEDAGASETPEDAGSSENPEDVEPSENEGGEAPEASQPTVETVTVKVPVCGYPEEEVEHTEECWVHEYSEEPVCNAEPHQHTDACYYAEEYHEYLNDDGSEPEEDVEVCGMTQHTHTAQCYNAEGQTVETRGEELLEQLKEALKNTSGDEEINLYLNGAAMNNVAIIVDGKTLNINDGNNGEDLDGTMSGDAQNRVIIIQGSGSVTLNGGVITNGNGGVYVKDGTFDMTGGEITGNEVTGSNTAWGDLDNNTGFYDENGNVVTLTGKQDKEDRDINVKGGGVYVGTNGQFNLSGGTISNNTAAEGGGVYVTDDWRDRPANAGGQGSAWRDNMLEDKSAQFNMTGGTIDGNTANVGEGGGIYLRGTGTITQGKITGNETKGTNDLGGGGIYIENTGRLDMLNVLITGNTAAGLGGGIAACVHGNTAIFASNGGAIFGNIANGNADLIARLPLVDGSSMYGAVEIDKDTARDILIAGNKQNSSNTINGYGTPGAIISNAMMGGGTADWSGKAVQYKLDSNGKPQSPTGATSNDALVVVSREHTDGTSNTGKGYVIMSYQKAKAAGYTNGSLKLVDVVDIEEGKEFAVTADVLLGLTAHVDDKTAQNIMDFVDGVNNGVLISGNTSATHGGGIANNGTLRIGTEEKYGFTELPTVDINKFLTTVDPNGNSVNGENDKSMTDKEFKFELVDENGTAIPDAAFAFNTVDQDGKSTAQFSLPASLFQNCTKSGDKVVFYIVEADTGVDGVIYDQTVYQVTIEVTIIETEKEEISIGNDGTGKPVKYTITKMETGEPTFVKGYFDENGKFVAEGPVAGGELNFNNKYETGSLTIQKVVTVEGDDSASLADQTYTFDVKAPDGTTKTVEVKGNGSTTITGLEPGVYTVTEQDASAEGYAWAVSGNGPVTVKRGETASTTITNTYSLKRGSLTISKKLIADADYPNSELSAKIFTFDIQGPASAAGVSAGDVHFDSNGHATVTITGANSKTINNLPYGNYTVTEQGADVEGYTLSVSGNGSTAAVGESGASVEITNTYTRDLGSLTISKTVTGDCPEAAEMAYSFAIEGPADANGTYGGVTFNGGKAVVSVPANGSVSIDGLPTGTYTVSEADASIPGYNWTASSNAENGAVVVTKGTGGAINVVNDYQLKVGDLTIQKVVSGGEDAPAAFTFSISSVADVLANGTFSGVTFTNGNATVTVPANGSVTIEGLPVGEYTVTEVREGIDITGYTHSVTGDGTTANVTEGGNVVAVITNTYTRDLGSLTIRKTDAATGAALAGATFTITGPDGYRNTVTTGADGTVTLTGLPTGTYTVTETSAPAGYILDAASRNVTVEKDDTAEISIANSRIPDNPPPEDPDDPEDFDDPEDPEETPQNTPDPEPTPEPTPEPISESEVDMPEPETPLAETPGVPEEEIDMPDEDVPLAEMPEETPEEEVELPDPDIPLGEVPRTGDMVGLWYLLSVLAAGALAVLKLLERKERKAK